MFSVTPISSFDAPDLAPYRTLRRAAEHIAQGIFVAEGDKVVQRLLTSRFGVVSVVLPEHRLEEFRPWLEARTESFSVYLADKKFLETLVGFNMFQGVLAVARMPATLALPELLAQSPAPRLFAAVDGLTSAENVGLLARNCAAFRVQGLIVGETSSSPFLRRAVRNSMGTIFDLPVLESTDLVATLQSLRAAGVRCVAAHPHTDRRTLSQADFRGDVCIIFGSEGHGISSRVLGVCDEAVAIPMPPNVDSLNVGAAAAVFLYETSRQRGEV